MRSGRESFRVSKTMSAVSGQDLFSQAPCFGGCGQRDERGTCNASQAHGGGQCHCKDGWRGLDCREPPAGHIAFHNHTHQRGFMYAFNPPNSLPAAKRGDPEFGAEILFVQRMLADRLIRTLDPAQEGWLRGGHLFSPLLAKLRPPLRRASSSYRLGSTSFSATRSSSDQEITTTTLWPPFFAPTLSSIVRGR